MGTRLILSWLWYHLQSGVITSCISQYWRELMSVKCLRNTNQAGRNSVPFLSRSISQSGNSHTHIHRLSKSPTDQSPSLQVPSLSCTVLCMQHCTVLHCPAFHYTTPHYTALCLRTPHCTLLCVVHGTTPHHTALHHTTQDCTTPHRIISHSPFNMQCSNFRDCL